jgi:MOSC domain-containing protein YiiM
MSEHRILRTWVRRAEGAVPEERTNLNLIPGEGVEDDHKRGAKRHVTLMFEDDWNAACAELGREVDPVGRRANVLLSGGNGGALIGKTVRLGATTLEIHGETRPCPIMDQAAEGLMEALRPDERAGVWGVVTEGGRIAPGDALVAG